MSARHAIYEAHAAFVALACAVIAARPGAAVRRHAETLIALIRKAVREYDPAEAMRDQERSRAGELD